MKKIIKTIAGGGFNSAVERKTAQKTLHFKLLATVVCTAVALFTLYGKDNGAVTAIAKGEATVTTPAGFCSAPLWSDGYVASLKPFSWWSSEYLDCVFIVHGKVIDCNGAPISDVRVTGYLAGDEANSSETVLTDSKGKYKFQFPAYSDVTITVKSSDYANYSPEVSCAIKGKSGGSVVQHHFELPCVECFWNGDTSVIINGVTWATRNVGAPGTFVCKPEDAGMFYQWNRKIGWSSTDPLVNSNGGTTWNYIMPDGTEWEKANDPSPAGWRVPTLDEIQILYDKDKVSSEWTVLNGVNGYLFTDKTTDKSLFLPAAGYRRNNNGALYDAAGTDGYCWSSTQDYTSTAYCLHFYSGYVFRASYYRSSGLPVRCVAE